MTDAEKTNAIALHRQMVALCGDYTFKTVWAALSLTMTSMIEPMMPDRRSVQLCASAISEEAVESAVRNYEHAHGRSDLATMAPANEKPA